MRNRNDSMLEKECKHHFIENGHGPRNLIDSVSYRRKFNVIGFLAHSIQDVSCSLKFNHKYFISIKAHRYRIAGCDGEAKAKQNKGL